MRHYVKGIVAACGLILHSALAWAQPVPPAQEAGPPAEVSWRVTGGSETISLRDIARTGTPVDASPVAWRGHGPALLIQHLRRSGRREHRFEVSAGRAGDFVYETSLESLARPESDSSARVDGRYEYRRYLFSDVLVRGLDIGAGAQGGLLYRRRSRHVPDGIEEAESRSALLTAVVATARFHRSPRVSVQVSWTNGGHIGRSVERYSVDAAANRTRWGGGWLTELAIEADVAVTRRTYVTIGYLRGDDGLLSSHRSFAGARRALTIGVTYAR